MDKKTIGAIGVTATAAVGSISTPAIIAVGVVAVLGIGGAWAWKKLNKRAAITIGVLSSLYLSYPLMQGMISGHEIQTFEKFWLMTTAGVVCVYGYYFVFYPLKNHKAADISPNKKLLGIVLLGIFFMLGRFYLDIKPSYLATSGTLTQSVSLDTETN